MSTVPQHTKPCPACGKPMPKQRGVCPDCGGMTPWFKIRLVLGCASVLLAALGLLAVLALALVTA